MAASPTANARYRLDLNFVLITAILNAKVYQDTIGVCGADGSGCTAHPDKAPVCNAIRQGKLIPGANVISTYSPDVPPVLAKLRTHASTRQSLTICSKGPYAGCMTAPCKTTTSGHTECSCPIFWGIFQLTGAGAECTLGDGLVNSASYAPAFDVLP